MAYVTVDDTAKAIVTMGQGTVLVKLDIKSASRIVPVHPGEHPLLGIMWKKTLPVDALMQEHTRM